MPHLVGAHRVHDRLAEGGRDGHDLVEATAPLVTQAPTLVATFALVDGVRVDPIEIDLRSDQVLVVVRRLDFAMFTDPTREPLRRDQVERRRHVERLEAHVEHTGNRTGAVVGVQSGQHEVSCERGLDRDTPCGKITDLTHHDDVRVLAQKRLERGRKVQPDLGADEDLIDPVQVVLDRVLRGHDVRVDRVDLRERRVKGRRLARAGRPRHEDHPVRLRDGVHEILLSLGLEAELLQIEGQVPLVENTEHDLLAEDHGQRRDPEVDDLVFHLELDAPILRNSSLGDVQIRKNLDT